MHTIGISPNRIQVDTTNPILKIAAAFTPQQRRDRINLIARRFSEIVSSTTLKLERNKEIELSEARANNDKVTEHLVLNALEMLDDVVKGRHYAIQYRTVESIVQKIQDEFEEVSNDSSETDEIRQKYRDIIDNFEYLLDQASYIIENDESLKLSVSKTTQFTGKDSSKEVVGGTIEQSEENLTDNDREQDDDDEEGNRATGNDGWSFKVRMVDPHNSMSKTTKRILSRLLKINPITKEYEEDDLGNYKYLDERYAHTVLLDVLSDLKSPEEFCIKSTREDGSIYYDFPALEKALPKYPWIEEVIRELTNSPSEVSAFYSDFRKDFIPYWKTKTIKNNKGKTVFATFRLNEATGYQSAKNQLLANYESGTRLDKDAVYDNNAKLIKENIEKGIKLLDSIDLQELEEEEEYNEVAGKIDKLLKMLGFRITDNSVKNIWDSPDGSARIFDLVCNLDQIYSSIEKQTTNSNYHMVSDQESVFNRISKIIGEIVELDAVGSFRNGDESYYSYSAPNYLNTQVKYLKDRNDTEREKYLQREFKEYPFFYDAKKKVWKGDAGNKKCLLSILESDETARFSLEVKNLLDIEDTEYNDWNGTLITKGFLEDYFSLPYNPGIRYQYAYYNYPIFSDSPIAMMIKLPKFAANYEKEIIPRLRQVVKQELERIKLVQDRKKAIERGEDISRIANFDGDRGNKFCFFPFLNDYVNEDGTSFRDKVYEITDSKGAKAADDYIEEVLSEYMERESDKFADVNFEIGKQVIGQEEKTNDAEVIRDRLKQYFYNHEYMETQIIQLTTTDLAYYKSGNDFQKRYKEVYASGTKLNTEAEYGKKYEKTIYLADNIITSKSYTDIKSSLEQTKAMWIKNGMDSKIAQASIDSILYSFRNINVADAQAYRSLDSFRSVLDMMGLWTKRMQQAFDRINNGEWDMADYNIIWQTIKPFVYTQISKDSGVDGTKIKVPHQNKNSEFLLLSMYQMLSTAGNKSPQLRALDRFMTDNHIDVVQFESAVKVGGQGIVDINYSRKKLDNWINDNPSEWDKILDASTISSGTDYEVFKDGNDNLLDKGEITQQEYNRRFKQLTPSEEETRQILEQYTYVTDESGNILQGTDSNGFTGSKLKPNVVHEIPYDDYMIAQPTPEHLFDRDTGDSQAVFGSQFRNLIISDLPEVDSKGNLIKYKVNGKEYTKEELLSLYNSLIVENLLDDYKRVSDRFATIESLQKAMLKVIKGNPKYGKNMLDALQLTDWTDPNTGETKKVFNLPLYSPSISAQIQEIVNSMFKNAVTKQKIKGAACVLVSNFGFTDQLNIKGSITNCMGNQI